MRAWWVATLAVLAAVVTAAAAVLGGIQLVRSVSRARPAAVSRPRADRSWPPGTATRPAAVPAGWRLTFAARFPGSRLDTSVWATCYPWMDLPSGCRNFGNRELEWYLPGQVRVSRGVLHLVARRLRTAGRSGTGAPKEYFCRSGMITSYPGLRFRYGYLQAVARIPPGPGLWPALWLAAANLRWPPEVDLIEHWGRSRHVNGVFFHPVGGPRVAAWPITADLGIGWHTFGLLWTRTRLSWYIDGRPVLSVHRHVPHQLMYFVADLADYWLPRSGACAGQLLIRSVRVWQGRAFAGDLDGAHSSPADLPTSSASVAARPGTGRAGSRIR
jgi:beta-glucanase (GH16 family)